MTATSELKVAIDYALCAVGRHRAEIYGSLLSSVCLAPVESDSSVLRRRPVMETLARAALSEPALQELVRSGLLDQVSGAIRGMMGCISFFSFGPDCPS